VWVKCQWRAEKPLRDAWTLVVQLVASGRTGQEQWTPLMGVYRLWNWRPGWSVDDTFHVAAPSYTRPGEGVLRVSWQWSTGTPVFTDDGREFVEVGAVRILPRPRQDPSGLEGITLPEAPPLGPEWSLPSLEPGVDWGEDEPAGDLDLDPPVSDDRGTAPAAGPDATPVPPPDEGAAD
jgi:hypothetical protein